MPMDSRVCQRCSYEPGSRLIHTSAASVDASKTAALPVSVRTNLRSGASSPRAHAVFPESRSPGRPVIGRFSLTPGSLSGEAPLSSGKSYVLPPLRGEVGRGALAVVPRAGEDSASTLVDCEIDVRPSARRLSLPQAES